MTNKKIMLNRAFYEDKSLVADLTIIEQISKRRTFVSSVTFTKEELQTLHNLTGFLLQEIDLTTKDIKKDKMGLNIYDGEKDVQEKKL